MPPSTRAEVDLIINYDAAGSSIRTTQRNGRTGRKRSGRIITLVAPGAEEKRVRKAHESGAKITKATTMMMTRTMLMR